MSAIRRLLLMDEHVCPSWLVHFFDNPVRRLVHDPAAIFGSMVAPGQTAVDVGCGAGYFSLGLARLVGPNGRVLALDVQDRMLEKLRRRAARSRLADRIELRLCEPDRLGLRESVDFVLAFWMLHEVQAAEAVLGEIREALRPSGRLLVVEPKVHVPAPRFDATVALLTRTGFDVSPGPRVRFSRSVVCAPGR